MEFQYRDELGSVFEGGGRSDWSDAGDEGVFSFFLEYELPGIILFGENKSLAESDIGWLRFLVFSGLVALGLFHRGDTAHDEAACLAPRPASCARTAKAPTCSAADPRSWRVRSPRWRQSGNRWDAASTRPSPR